MLVGNWLCLHNVDMRSERVGTAEDASIASWSKSIADGEGLWR